MDVCEQLKWDSNSVPSLGPAAAVLIAVRVDPENGMFVGDHHVRIGVDTGNGVDVSGALASGPRSGQSDNDVIKSGRLEDLKKGHTTVCTLHKHMAPYVWSNVF